MNKDTAIRALASGAIQTPSLRRKLSESAGTVPAQGETSGVGRKLSEAGRTGLVGSGDGFGSWPLPKRTTRPDGSTVRRFGQNELRPCPVCRGYELESPWFDLFL